MKPGSASGLWLPAAVIAIVNGYFGKAYVPPRLGEYGVHVYKSLFMVAVIFLLGWVYARQTAGAGWLGAALGAGLMWVGLTVIFAVRVWPLRLRESVGQASRRLSDMARKALVLGLTCGPGCTAHNGVDAQSITSGRRTGRA